MFARKIILRSCTVAAKEFRVSGVRMISSTPISFGNYSYPADGKPEPFLNPKEVTSRILEVIKNFEKVDPSKVTDTARFKEDLDLDSLDAVEVVMAVEEEFGIEIPDSEADKILAVPDAVNYVSAHPMAK